MRRLFLLFLFLIFTLLAVSQEENDSSAKRKGHFFTLEGGIPWGGFISNGRFYQRTGKDIHLSFNKGLNSKVFYGLSVGGEFYAFETFLPVQARITGFLSKKDKAPFFLTMFGYSHAWNRKYQALEKYDFHGGFSFSQGFGYKLKAGKDRAFLFSVSYKHQFASTSYKSFDSEKFRDFNNFNLVVFHAGFLFAD